MKKHSQKPKCVKSTTFNVDIAEEFNEIKNTLTAGLNKLDEKLDSFKNEINAWKQEFVKQLTILNTNMDKVLSQIAEHEGRITKLEQDALKNETRKQTVSELSKFGWMAAKIAISAGAIIGAVGGCGWVLKLLSVF